MGTDLSGAPGTGMGIAILTWKAGAPGSRIEATIRSGGRMLSNRSDPSPRAGIDGVRWASDADHRPSGHALSQ